MNYSIIRFIIGWILIFEAAFLTLPCIVAAIYQETDGFVYLGVLLLCLILGFLLGHKRPENKVFFAREGFAAVALSWIVLSVFGSLPFIFTGAIPNPVDALFETVSGFTTTGASILSDVEALSHCNLFWRSFTHWIGGMGILVFMLAILPMTGGSHMNLMRAESPGPSVSKFAPKVRTTAKILYIIYIAMTLIQIVFLLIGKMPLFDALTLTFGTAGTGGFGIKNDSITSYSPYLQNVITIFMILFGVNFAFYYILLQKKIKQAFKLSEVRTYLLIILGAVLIIAFNIRGLYDNNIGEALHHSAFQVASIITTTGYATTDFNLWPELSRTILVILMFIGACAGSTGGGIKVSRVIILVKSIFKELNQFVHPTGIRKIQIDGRPLSQETLRSVNVYMSAYFLIFVISIFLITFENHDLITNFTAVATTLNNVGPGLELVGPTQNFGFFSMGSKLVLTFDMLAGRLELFPLLLLFVRDTWKKF